MLQLQTLKLKNFRSFRKLDMEFLPGLTLLTGDNGAGKTTVRLGVQYALTGKVPGLKKAELRNDTPGVSHMTAEVGCLLNGKETTISKQYNSTTITQDGVEYDVREASFLDPIKKGIAFAFLSADQAHFIDVQEFKRKQMLNSLIEEVGFLRKQCTGLAKDFKMKIFNRRQELIRTVNALEANGLEYKDILAEADGAVRSEQARLDGLRAEAENGLPYTYTQCAEFQRRKTAVEERLKAVQAKRNECSTWLTGARKHNTRILTHRNEFARVKNALDSLLMQKSMLQERLVDAQETLVCQACHGQMVCKECGKPFRITAKEDKIKADIALVDKKIPAAQAQFDKQKAIQEKGHQLSKDEDMDRIERAIVTYDDEIGSLTDEFTELDKAIRSFELAEAKLAELERITNSESHLQQLQENAASLRERIAGNERAIARKVKAIDVLERTSHKTEAAITLLYEQMPAVYYSIFLGKLEGFCQYLLNAISDLTISLKSLEDGIEIMVGNRKVQQLSSGQRQRVRIATTLAFALMAPRCDTLFIDEVFDTYLDEEGVALFAQLINGPMREFFSKIILVSHRPEVAIALGPERVWHMTLSDDGESTLTIQKEAS